MIPIEVDLISCTGMNDDGAAKDLLIYTKSTRLEQGRRTQSKIENMTIEEKLSELEYMANTIPSSWEFINYVFSIRNVTRAFTHQLVRTRTGSYAQQTMRMLNKKAFTYRIPPQIRCASDKQFLRYKNCMAMIQNTYDLLIENGAAVEDARGVLPTNIHTNIIAQFNLRTVAEMARSRTGTRTQDEYREVMELMIDCVILEHPWAKLFLIPEEMKHIKGLEDFIMKLFDSEIISDETKFEMLKHLDKLRKGEK